MSMSDDIEDIYPYPPVEPPEQTHPLGKRYRLKFGQLVEDPEGQWTHVGDCGVKTWVLDTQTPEPSLTCYVCRWGRDGKWHSRAEYDRHMAAEHL